MDLKQYINAFVEEANEHLQSMHYHLLELGKNHTNEATINELFRAAHTLKGSSATMGFNQMAGLTHEMENVLDDIRQNKNEITTELIDTLFHYPDTIEGILDHIVEFGIEDEARQSLTDVFQIHIILDKGCLLKAARAFVIFREIKKNAEIIRTVPALEEIENELFDFEFAVTVKSELTEEELYQSLTKTTEIESITIRREEDGINETISEKTVQSADIDASVDHLLKTVIKKSKMGKTVRVDINQLDGVLSLVSELLIKKTHLEEINLSVSSEAFSKTIEDIERISTNLQDMVLKIRMVKIGNAFDRLPKLVHDISRRLCKEIDLLISGGETELDRTVVDELGEPLLHIIRNAIDHGIESPEERLRRGKLKKGFIQLRAYQDRTNVVIEVFDDGRGIDVEKVKQRAIETGKISIEAANELSQSDALKLVFLPSLTTKDTITEISGRGVGLDVVQNKIEIMGGEVNIDSKENIGTSITIKLPLTLAMVQALLVRVREEKYAIPMKSLNQIIKIKKEDIKIIQNREVILLREVEVPVFKLAEILEVPETGENLEEFLTVVISKQGEQIYGFIADEILGEQEIVQKPLGKYFRNNKAVTGATVLGDGNVSLILDVNALT